MRGETSAPPASGFLVHWKEIVIVQVFCTVARNCFFIHYNREFIIRKRGKFGCCSSGGILRGGLLREEEAGVGTDRYGYRAVRGEDGREKNAGSFGISPGRLFVVSGFGAMPYLNLLQCRI